jgi:hypothetical protein
MTCLILLLVVFGFFCWPLWILALLLAVLGRK